MKKILMAISLLGMTSALVFAVISGHSAVYEDCHSEWKMSLKNEKASSRGDNSVNDLLVYHFSSN